MRSKKFIKKYLKYTPVFAVVFAIIFGIFNLNIAHAAAAPGWNPFSFITDLVFDGIGGIVAQILGWLFEFLIIPLMSWVMTIFGNLLDQAINFSLQTTLISNLQGIKDGWVIFRDIINISFIFILLYIAISTILGTQGSADKKVLANLVIATLFINFSMFIAGLFIDVGNIIGLAFRSAIVVDSSSGGLGAIVMKAMNLTSTYSPSGFGYSSLISAGIRVLLIGITIYAFFVASVLFVARIISFIILLILSPIGFVGMVLPKLKSYSDKWWSTLVGQSVVAPIFLFFFYVIARITTSGAFEKNMLSEAGNIDVTYYFNFAIIIGLILVAVKITKEMSGEIGKKALSYAKTATIAAGGLVGGAALGATAVAGRAVVGRGAASLMARKTAEGTLKDTLAKGAARGGFKGFGSKVALKSLQKTEQSSFDLRNTQVGKFGLGQIKGVNFGKGIKEGGYKKVVKETVKKHRDFAKVFGKGTKGKILKQQYAESLKKPWFMGGKEVNPDSSFGKALRHVQAGGNIEKEMVRRDELGVLKKQDNDLLVDIGSLSEQLEAAKRNGNVARSNILESQINIAKNARKNVTSKIKDKEDEIKDLLGEDEKKK